MVQTASVLYDVNDFKVNSLTDDNEGSPTYSPDLVDVPGIASVSMEPNIVTAELKGDAKVIAKKGNTDRFNFSATYGRLSLPALVVLIGGTVTETPGTDTTPGSAAYAISGTNSLPYFKAQFQILQGEVADTHITAYKCQVTGGTLLDQSTDNFGQPEIEFESIPTLADESLFVKIEFLDQATALA